MFIKDLIDQASITRKKEKEKKRKKKKKEHLFQNSLCKD